jgi:hypothetical protein
MFVGVRQLRNKDLPLTLRIFNLSYWVLTLVRLVSRNFEILPNKHGMDLMVS